MNTIDIKYQELLQDILDNGVEKGDRTGTGTISVFGRQIHHKMSQGFPLLTTKKMAWNVMVAELLWFLRGDTNIKFLLDYDCHIWDGDCYANYLKGGDIKWLKNIEVETPLGKMNVPIPYTKEEFINKIKTDAEFAERWGELGPIYGKQWRSWKKPNHFIGPCEDEYTTDCGFITKEEYEESRDEYEIDQISNLINDLKTNPDSRRLMVSAWNVGELKKMVLPPCHYGFQVYTRELHIGERQLIAEQRGYRGLIHSNAKGYKRGSRIIQSIKETCDSVNIPKRAISLMWNQRSVDTFLGLPFNIASYGLLLEIIAKEVNMVPDELIGNLGDVHLYSNHIEQAKEQISREPYELPQVQITERNWYMHEKVEEHLGPKTFNEKIMSYRPDCFELIDYKSHPKIKAPLSN